MNQLVKFLLDLGPLVVFVVANGRFGIFAATAAFMVATVIAIVVGFVIEKKVPRTPLITGIFVLIFGGLTLYLKDDTFIKVKPTLVYALFAAILFIGTAMGRHPLRYLFDSAIPGMTERGWKLLALRWGWFFVAMAVANEIAWRLVSTDTWVSLKLFAFLPASLVFALAQTPLITRHSDLGKRDAAGE
jgi:intracellular septation protein